MQGRSNKNMPFSKYRCYGCEDGCDSCMKPLARPGIFDTDILIQHTTLLHQLITCKLDKFSKRDECLYSLKKQEPLGSFISTNEGTIMIQRCSQRRDTTEIIVERLKDGKDFEDSFFITITPSGNVITWNNIMTYERCKRWCNFFEKNCRGVVICN
jgi:hypothetical protein